MEIEIRIKYEVFVRIRNNQIKTHLQAAFARLDTCVELTRSLLRSNS